MYYLINSYLVNNSANTSLLFTLNYYHDVDMDCELVRWFQVDGRPGGPIAEPLIQTIVEEVSAFLFMFDQLSDRSGVIRPIRTIF